MHFRNCLEHIAPFKKTKLDLFLGSAQTVTTKSLRMGRSTAGAQAKRPSSRVSSQSKKLHRFGQYRFGGEQNVIFRFVFLVPVYRGYALCLVPFQAL